MCHHDLTIGSDGTIFTFVQKNRIYPDFNAESAIFDEFVVELNQENGEIIREMSLIEAFHGSVFSSWLKKTPVAGDIFHANTIEYIGSDKSRSATVLSAWPSLDFPAKHGRHTDHERGNRQDRVGFGGTLVLPT